MLGKAKTRGAVSNPEGRFQHYIHQAEPDGWYKEEENVAPLTRIVLPDKAKTIINYNNSPDVPFDRSVNPYRGCEHGCIYCFARPTHSYLDLSPGLDFETRLFYKADAVEKLENELRKPNYQVQPIVLGINTDAYQPLEKELQLTRKLLQLLLDYRHPVSLLTKSQLILRDMDILQELALHNLVSVGVSITSMQQSIKSTLEPRTASPCKRMQIIRRLAENKIPVGVMVAPVIPVITDHELESIMGQAREAGAIFAGYALLRLPHELKDVFTKWLETYYPFRSKHILNLLKQSHKGKLYHAEWDTRSRGSGEYADMLEKRYELALQRCGYPKDTGIALNVDRFRMKPKSGEQVGFDF